MSELTNASDRRGKLLWQLLNTASALALIGTMAAIPDAKAAQDEDQPIVWVELGGSLQRLNTSEENYTPPFILQTPRPSPETVDPLSVGHLPKSSFGEEGKITFQPENSSWIFSAAAQFGRSGAHQHLHQQSHSTGPLAPIPTPSASPMYQHVFQFIDAGKTSSESHTIVDFQAGSDVGLGMFGAGSSSVFNAGVRFAQFNANSATSFGSDPDAKIILGYFVEFPGLTIPFIKSANYHINTASASASRSFHGIGPTLSWNASTPVVGHSRDGEIALDWGANAAILFGRQRADVHHQSTARYHHGKYYNAPVTPTYPDPGTDRHRSRTVIVPNVGGFAGFTFRLQDFKVSAGYRADFFFGAMDGGVDTAKKENVGFYGPFASVSVGLGG